jgi:hypothetical protein
MRFALALTVLCGCHALYDPVAEIPHAEYVDTTTAIRAVLDEAGAAKVYAVGEYHPRAGMAMQTPLAWFTGEIMALLVPRSRHVVIETWSDPGCTIASRRVQAEVASTIGRPASTSAELSALVQASQRNQLATHGLPISCIEHGALLDPTGRVDFLRLLELVTEKLEATTRALVDDDRAVIVYGGALHNDLYPRWPLADLSYARPLARELRGGVVELDLIVPEVVAPLAMVRLEPWFPLLGRAAPGRVVVWQRGPASFVVILPAQSLEPAKVALPIASI